MRASIIISNSISQDVLAACTLSACTQRTKAEHEVLLPDLGNLTKEEDALIRLYAEHYPHFRRLEIYGENRSVILNGAARAAKGSLLLFLESHCVPGAGWLEAHLAHFEATGSEVIIGETRIMPSDNWVRQAEEAIQADVRARARAENVLDTWLDFHNTSIARECFFRFGGLDEDIRHTGEFDLGARMHQSGARFDRLSGCPVLHVNDGSLRAFSRAIKEAGRDRTRILQKRGRAFMQRYFPNHKFLAFLPLIRAVPHLFLAAAQLSILAGRVLFPFAAMMRSKSLARTAFGLVGANSLRFGMVDALRERSRS